MFSLHDAHVYGILVLMFDMYQPEVRRKGTECVSGTLGWLTANVASDSELFSWFPRLNVSPRVTLGD